jgi:hypothetical protein
MRALLALLVLLTLTACSPINREDVVGTYILGNGTTVFTLQLKPDGTYIHTCIKGTGERVERTGIWEWEEKDTDNPLALDNFAEFPEEEIGGISGSPGIYIIHPERSAQGIRFPVGDPDSPSHYFIRQDSSPH